MSLTNYLFAYATFRKSFFLMHILFYAHLLHICVSVSVVLKFDSLEDLCELSIYGFCVKCLECCTATAKTCYHQRSKPINASQIKRKARQWDSIPWLVQPQRTLARIWHSQSCRRDLLFPGTQVFCSVRSVWQLWCPDAVLRHFLGLGLEVFILPRWIWQVWIEVFHGVMHMTEISAGRQSGKHSCYFLVIVLFGFGSFLSRTNDCTGSNCWKLRGSSWSLHSNPNSPAVASCLKDVGLARSPVFFVSLNYWMCVIEPIELQLGHWTGRRRERWYDNWLSVSVVFLCAAYTIIGVSVMYQYRNPWPFLCLIKCNARKSIIALPYFSDKTRAVNQRFFSPCLPF